MPMRGYVGFVHPWRRCPAEEGRASDFATFFHWITGILLRTEQKKTPLLVDVEHGQTW